MACLWEKIVMHEVIHIIHQNVKHVSRNFMETNERMFCKLFQKLTNFLKSIDFGPIIGYVAQLSLTGLFYWYIYIKCDKI